MHIFVLIMALALSGCGLLSNDVVTLSTNRQEIVAYAETFNSVQSAYRLEIQYRDNPSRSLDGGADAPDLVVTENIAGSLSIGRFRSVNRLFDKKRLSRSSFYSQLLNMGQKDKQQILMPISFDLPAVMFDARIPGEEVTAFFINLEHLQELASRYNKTREGSFISMGFAPRWNPDFLVQTAAMQGVDFIENSSGKLSWNDRRLRETVRYLRDWSESRNGGGEAEISYGEKYLYDPPYRQVALGRARFAYTTVAEYFLLPENRRISLDFRWIAGRNRILALENVLFAGIPVRGKNPRGAEAFLRWLFDAETQTKLLELSRRKMVNLFGIASGFSSLRDVNERILTRFYPHLAGHIPPEDILYFPPAVTPDWSRIKQQVIMPWLLRQTAAAGDIEDLGTYLETWLQQQTF